MKVKLLVSRAGVDSAHSPGDVIDVSDAEALRMVEAGQAILIETRKAETTTRRTPKEKR